MIQKAMFVIRKSFAVQGTAILSKTRRAWCLSVLAGLMTCGLAVADSGESWTFTLNDGSTTKGLLTSGDWVLNAQLKSAGSNELQLGNGSWATATAYVAGSGVLDLTTPISMSGGGGGICR